MITMKYEVINLRTNEKEIVYNNLEEAQCYITISVYSKNTFKNSKEKRWTKNDFQIIEVK